MVKIIMELSHYLLLISLSALFSYVFISFFEVVCHRELMHCKNLPKFIYRLWPYMLYVFESHAIMHHGRWYREFDFEPDPEGRDFNVFLTLKETTSLLMVIFPAIVLFFAISPVLGVTFLTTCFVHNKLWNLLHGQMHMPKPTFFAQWPLFHWLARYHYMHHQATNKNYNIVFPLADYVLGSHIDPRFQDLRQMLYLGHLRPRSTRVKMQVEARRTAVEKERAVLLAS